jgi:AraC-like DNA-binding protein
MRLAELSALVNMSPYHFARLFRPILAIACALGFRTANHFTGTFRRLVGLTPTA